MTEAQRITRRGMLEGLGALGETGDVRVIVEQSDGTLYAVRREVKVTGQSVSENPYFTFTFRATEPGQLRITFRDTHGRTYEGTADITFS